MNGSILCNLDIEKAYCCVSWIFLLAILEKMDFLSKWRSWISFCISTVHSCILINVEAFGFFFSSRGLRQGEPLSPLLFILFTDTLGKLMSKAVEEVFLDDFHNSNPRFKGLLISHMLFSDDTLILCKPDGSNLGYLRCILLAFKAVFGLRVNLFIKWTYSHWRVA